jgi:hypothetical protein
MTSVVPEKVKKDKAEAEAQRDQILRGKVQIGPEGEPKKLDEQQNEAAAKAAAEEAKSAGNDGSGAGEVPSGKEPVKFPVEQTASAQSEAELKLEIERLRKEQQRIAGQFGSEIQRWREQLSVAMNDNLELAKQLHEAKDVKPKSGSQDMKPEDLSPEKYLTDEEKADYDGMIKVITKISKAVFESMSSGIEAPVQKITKDLEAIKIEQIANSFVNSVDALAPGFKVANGNPDLGVAPQDKEWIAFLGNQNEITGKSLGQEIMEIADQNARIRAAANAFNSYQKSKTVAVSRPAAVVDPVPERRKSSSTSTADADKARTTGPKRYSMKEYNELLRKAQELGIGFGKGRELYEELADAARQGRLDP